MRHHKRLSSTVKMLAVSYSTSFIGAKIKRALSASTSFSSTSWSLEPDYHTTGTSLVMISFSIQRSCQIREVSAVHQTTNAPLQSIEPQASHIRCVAVVSKSFRPLPTNLSSYQDPPLVFFQALCPFRLGSSYLQGDVKYNVYVIVAPWYPCGTTQAVWKSRGTANNRC